jgi:predicted RNase H-like HicB family nuclease
VSEYVIVIEGDGATNYSAYVPDLPGCVATGETVAEVTARIREAIQLHIESLQTHAEPVPAPSARTDRVQV